MGYRLYVNYDNKEDKLDPDICFGKLCGYERPELLSCVQYLLNEGLIDDPDIFYYGPVEITIDADRFRKFIDLYCEDWFNLRHKEYLSEKPEFFKQFYKDDKPKYLEWC